VSFPLQSYVCVLLYCVLTVLCQVALTQARQARHAKSGEMNAKEMLTQASCTQKEMSSQLARLRSQRKVEKQAERHSRLVGGACVRSASVTEKLEQQLRMTLAENEIFVTDLADLSDINALYSICRIHFKLLLYLFILFVYNLFMLLS
jgi:hypothetical protein